MMYLETPPRLIETKVFSAMPEAFRRKVRTDWADANRPGAPTDCFIEGPSFDADGQSLHRRHSVRAHLPDRAGRQVDAGGRI